MIRFDNLTKLRTEIDSLIEDKVQAVDFVNIMTSLGALVSFVKMEHRNNIVFLAKRTDNENGSAVPFMINVTVHYKTHQYAQSMTHINMPFFLFNEVSERCIYHEHLVLPIIRFTSSIAPFIDLKEKQVIPSDDILYSEFVSRYENGEFLDNVTIFITEVVNTKTLDLNELLRNEILEQSQWKIIFFQLIATLASIQKEYPEFRHNDLKANHIKVAVKKPIPKVQTYKIGSDTYCIDDVKYSIRLDDFNFSCIPGLVDNPTVTAKWTDVLNIKPVKNRYYDMHYFFNSLTGKGYLSNFFDDNIIPDEAKEFVRRIVPEQYRVGMPDISSRGRLLVDDEYLIPEDVLKNDPYFEEFKVGDMNEEQFVVTV